ncbi:hypothetical protein AgCh_008677 [Apium graveolens]
MHYLKRKKFGKEGFMALKLDMSKAYDRIEWLFLKVIMLKMGFSNQWTHLIMQCVSTVEYTINHGEIEIGPIKPTRGLRQGDPLFPYLFIICAEGLSSLIKHYEDMKCIQGIRIYRNAPMISHMLFADDSYLFCKAEELQIQQADCSTKYLGLPNTLGRNKSVVLGYLKEKNIVKVTVDVAIFSELESSRIGIIAHDHHGSLLEAMTRRFNEVMNPSMVEAIAIKEALSWAKNKQCNQITIEYDCLVVVQLIRSSTLMRSVLGKVIKECRRFITDSNNVELYFIKRSANMAAYELAQVSHMYPDRSFGWSSVPVKVKMCILDDLNE